MNQDTERRDSIPEEVEGQEKSRQMNPIYETDKQSNSEIANEGSVTNIAANKK